MATVQQIAQKFQELVTQLNVLEASIAAIQSDFDGAPSTPFNKPYAMRGASFTEKVLLSQYRLGEQLAHLEANVRRLQNAVNGSTKVSDPDQPSVAAIAAQFAPEQKDTPNA